MYNNNDAGRHHIASFAHRRMNVYMALSVHSIDFENRQRNFGAVWKVGWLRGRECLANNFIDLHNNSNNYYIYVVCVVDYLV